MFIDKLETEDFDGFAKKNLGFPLVMRNAFKKCGENLCLKNSEKNTRLLVTAF